MIAPLPPEVILRPALPWRSVALARVAGAAVAAAVLVASTASAGATRVHSGPASPALGIRHVFVIVLENEDFAAAYGGSKLDPYLSQTLRRQGTLLTQYYGTGHLSNDNYISMVSGQAPNPVNQSDCDDYVDFEPSPAVIDPLNGQAVGQGCVFPSNVLTVADQLQAARLSWHGYMGDMGNDPNREPAHCGEPASTFGTGMRDGTQSAEAQDQYAARHNPFVYFHSLIDSGACHRNVDNLRFLSQDLKRVATTPNLSFITPNLCDDGHDAPCAGKDAKGSNAGGLVGINDFLSVWVPRIEASPAFRKDGLLVITTDEATVSPSDHDTTACCGESPGPNSPLPGIFGMGGGRIGTLVIGRCVAHAGTDATPYNHYSLLRSIEDLFGITKGGADGKGHLGFAGAAGLHSFGRDLFTSCR